VLDLPWKPLLAAAGRTARQIYIIIRRICIMCINCIDDYGSCRRFAIPLHFDCMRPFLVRVRPIATSSKLLMPQLKIIHSSFQGGPSPLDVPRTRMQHVSDLVS
jgi:hypothetical protein